MGVLDFLFEGKPPPSVTTYGSSSTTMPTWYTDYMQGIIGKANIVASEGYQPYQGQRIAGFNQDQNRAFDMTRSNVGAWQPALAGANVFSNQAGNTDAVTAAQPYTSAASGTTYGNITPYMNPYVENVIDRAGTLAGREYNENIRPALESQFTRAGSYGSVAHQREADRAARDLAEGLQGQAQSALGTAYDKAGEQYQADASRMAGLAGTVGNLALGTGNLKLGASQQMADMAKLKHMLGLSDTATLQGIGQQQQDQTQKNLDLARGDFEAQRDYPRQMVDWLNSVLRGMEPPKTITETKQGPLPNSKYGPSLIDQLGQLASIWKGVTEEEGD